MGIIAGLGRGMPERSPPPAGGRGGRVSSWSPVAGCGRRTTTHALAGRERVVARARRAGPARSGRGAGFGVAGFGAGPGAAAARGLGSAGRLLVGDRLGGPARRPARRRLGRGLATGLVVGGGGSGGLLGGSLRGRAWPQASPPAASAACGRLQLLAVLLAEAHLGGQLDGRARRLDELAHLLELLENELALDSELLGEFVDSGLGHGSPSGLRPASGVTLRPLVGVANSLRVTHRVLMSCCSSFCRSVSRSVGGE